MDLTGWNERYQSGTRTLDDPTPLVIRIAGTLIPGLALDLASGTGRNALWLAEQGWRVTAVDGAAPALGILGELAQHAGLQIQLLRADLSKGEFNPLRNEWDLVLICYYLQRELFNTAKAAVRPGGVLLSIVHTTEGNEEPTPNRMYPGELQTYFGGWEILHSYEGQPEDPAHKRAVAEIVARRPL